MKTSIYTLSSPNDNTVMYVGLSVNPDNRYKQHITERSGTQKGEWISKLMADGKRPVMDIIDYADPDSALELERKWIGHFLEINPDLFNVRDNPTRLPVREPVAPGLEKTKPTTIRLTKRAKELLSKLADKLGVSQSDVIEMAIREKAKKEEAE